jgi:ribonucleoside-diphosphate reductase alpha chain
MVTVKKRDGSVQEFTPEKLLAALLPSCEGLAGVDARQLLEDCKDAVYDGVTTDELDRALVNAAKARVHLHYNYSKVAARLFRIALHKQVGLGRDATRAGYGEVFKAGLTKLVAAGRLCGETVARYNLGRMAAAIRPERDDLFWFMGLKTLEDGYLLKLDGKVVELPQAFFMRVAMGLAKNEAEGDREVVALRFYETMSNLRAMPSTPTLFNSATPRSQLSSCFLGSISDSIHGIYGGIHQQAMLSKYAGGLGVDFSQVRAAGAHIRGTSGKSSGIVPFMKLFNDTLNAVDQGGRRRGSGAVYLQTWHLDIEDFLAVRKNVGDERLRCHNTNTALWHPDLFFKRVQEQGDWTLLCPSECPELNELDNAAFEAAYVAREADFDAGRVRGRRLKALDLWRDILKSMRETGHPWVTLKDPSNFRYADRHAGIVRSSNLCCVWGGDRVVTQHGIVRVDELAALNADGGDNIVAGRSQLRRASAMVMTIPNTEVVKVRTKQGYEHTVTPDHPLWVVDEGWREAKDLKRGDRVELQSATDALWGSLRDASARLAEDGFVNPRETVPDSVWRGDREVVSAYLASLFRQCFICALDPDGILVSVEAFSRDLLAGAQVLLANFGLHSRLTPRDSAFRLSVVVGSQACARALAEAASFVVDGDSRALPAVRPDRLRSAEVEAVEPAGRADTYCLMVDADDRAWTCNGLITKNTEIIRHSVATEYLDEFTPANLDEQENAVCNIHNINPLAHLRTSPDGEVSIDWDELAHTTRTVVRALDNVIDANFYPTRAAEQSNKRYRPVAFGQMGWADLLAALGIVFDSAEAAELADRLNEFLAYHAALASIDLARERGRYPRYEGSLWSKGVLPIDTFEELFVKRRAPEDRPPVRPTLDWDVVRRGLAEHGIRNGSLLAVPPTATVASVCGVSDGVDPLPGVVFVKSTMRGEFTYVIRSFVDRCERLGLWGDELARKLVAANGDPALVPEVPRLLRDLYKTAFQVDQKANVLVNAVRQAWVDQAISFNIYADTNSLKELSGYYLEAYRRGLKSTYYLHSRAASEIEHSIQAAASPPPAEVAGAAPATCRIDNPGCEACQ